MLLVTDKDDVIVTLTRPCINMQPKCVAERKTKLKQVKSGEKGDSTLQKVDYAPHN